MLDSLKMMTIPPWKAIVVTWKDGDVMIFLIKTAEIRNENNSKAALKRRVFGVKRNLSQGITLPIIYSCYIRV